MLKKKVIGLLVAAALVLTTSVATPSHAGTANTNDFSKLSGQIVVSLDRENTQYSGKFLGHKGEGKIYIQDKQKGIMLLYVNDQKVNVSPYIHKPSGEVIEVNIGQYVNEGENKIEIRTTGKDSTKVVVPYLTLKDGVPSEAGMNSDILNKIDSAVNDGINSGITPGAVVLVARNGIIVKNAAYGYAQKYDMGKLLDNPRVMTTDTLFDMASCTKVMATTQAIMKLVSEGKLNVDDTVTKYIPEFAKNGKENVKIKDLLTHTSGLTPWKPTWYYGNTPADELKFICNLPLEYPTGSQYKYSDFSFMTLGFVVEKITGQTLDQYVENKIYSPLGMKDSMFTPPVSLRDRIAATSWGNPYEENMVKTGKPYPVDVNFEDFTQWRKYTLVGEVNDGNSFYANGGVAGHAGLFSTTGDLAVLGQAMLNGGGYDTTKVYDKAVIDEFATRHYSNRGYGFEFDMSYMGSFMEGGKPSSTAFGHNGFTGTHVIFDPQYNLQIIVLTNKQNNGLNSKQSYPSTFTFCKNISNLVYQSINN
ncbi:serine hydrolase [Clostridium sp. YIM B02515]|uniref:Serine hydrolase n=1 Tax=Clostridium rhizosphaerae TaxID=2803861 RepID=A0ABS1T4Q6_9CLOT|nr:serine hydrolase [Clostridium rhizosphaerae]MBL4934308.1 serine hydrolase [Clostridium rhizosphaerae]